MRVTNKQKLEIVGLLQNGYSIDSIHKVINKEYKNLNISKSDIIVLAKQYNVKQIGKKDLSKENVNLQVAEQIVSNVLNNEAESKSLKHGIIVVFICLLILFGNISYFVGLKVGFIFLGVIVFILILLSMIVYFKFIKKSSKIKSEIFKKNK